MLLPYGLPRLFPGLLGGGVRTNNQTPATLGGTKQSEANQAEYFPSATRMILHNTTKTAAGRGGNPSSHLRDYLQG